MNQFFTVIGGMGTMATQLYINMVNRKTPAYKDQDYLDYILVNYATVPDRSSYIMNPKDNINPGPYLVDVVKTQSKLKPNFFVLTCNTAHYFYPDLVEVTDIPILHMPKLAVDKLKETYPKGSKVGIIGTEGTIRNKIYDNYLEDAGFTVVHPNSDIQGIVSELIFEKIKGQNILDSELYLSALNKMFENLDCDAVLLGCTELSLMEDSFEIPNDNVLDPQNILADETVRLALDYRSKQ